MGSKALVVGGSNGIGLAIVKQLLGKGYDNVYVLDLKAPEDFIDHRIIYRRINLASDDFSTLESIDDIDTLIITAGFGRVAPFDSIQNTEIINSFKVNTVSVIQIIKHYYDKLVSSEDFYCSVMGSIAGYVSSPLFSVYGSTKAALCNFTESINIELEKHESKNRILNVSPGSIKGTKFSDGANNLNLTVELADEIIFHMFKRKTLYIPEYKEIYRSVIDEYRSNSHQFGLKSYEYKESSNRINLKPQIKIGYLSGTFDLFHVGHLNLLRRAKEYCDYLVVGVHKDASHKGKEVVIPFNNRVEIVKNIRYVDKVIESFQEDNQAWESIKYNYLFVGSDYKGSERFNKYEEFFDDKEVEIIYFPYTDGTSSTTLRQLIHKK